MTTATKKNNDKIGKVAIFTLGSEKKAGVIREVLDGGRLFGISFLPSKSDYMATIDLPKNKFRVVG